MISETTLINKSKERNFIEMNSANMKTDINSKKKCFIITPVGPDGSEIRVETNGIIEAVIKPVLETDYDIIAAHLSIDSVQITKEIIQNIYHSDLVIANLSGSNPNVLYELSLAHALRKPVVHIIRDGEKPPFDISAQRYISFTNNMIGVVQLKNQLRIFVDSVMKEGSSISNPITDAIDNISVESSERTLSLDDGLNMISQRLSSIEKIIYKSSKYRSNGELDSNIFSDKKYQEFVDFLSDHGMNVESLLDNHENISQLSDILGISTSRIRIYIQQYLSLTKFI